MSVVLPLAAIPIGEVAMGLCGGLALFLIGLDQMTTALKTIAGGRMRHLLARATANRFKAIFAGTFVTAIIQSSSVTTVLVVGFVSARLLDLGQAVGLILGANVGTTITTQVIAFKVTHFGLLMIAVGFAAQVLWRKRAAAHYGTVLLGLGLVFFGMQVMSDATEGLRGDPTFIALMQEMSHPLWGILLGATFTALVQSSSATTGVVIVLAGQGLISLEAGITLALGANVGTCVTALLAAVGRRREALQAALVHVIFNVAGVLIWLGLVGTLADIVRGMSPTATDLAGTARLAAETPRQVANAHTIFNLANALLFLGFTVPLARLVQRLVPARPEETAIVRPKFLAEVYLDTPALALDRVRLELGHLGQHVLRMTRAAREAVSSGEEHALSALEQMDDGVDALHAAIVEYVGSISRANLSFDESEQVTALMAAANYLENIGDTVETNLVVLGRERLRRTVTISVGTREILGSLHSLVITALETALEALSSGDRATALRVRDMKGTVNRRAERARDHLLRRLTADAPQRPWTFRFESDVIENLKRIYYFAKRVARCARRLPPGASGPDLS